MALVLCLPFVAGAQEKQRFANLDEALQAGAILSGRQGPRNVNWIEGGKRYSYTDRDPQTNAPIIRAYDPASGVGTTLFTAAWCVRGAIGRICPRACAPASSVATNFPSSA